MSRDAGDDGPTMDDDAMICHRCGRELEPGDGRFWIVRIDAICDPSPPRVDPDESVESLVADYEAMLAEMSQMSERELMDQVHRRVVLHLCASCFDAWYDNPLG